MYAVHWIHSSFKPLYYIRPHWSTCMTWWWPTNALPMPSPVSLMVTSEPNHKKIRLSVMTAIPNVKLPFQRIIYWEVDKSRSRHSQFKQVMVYVRHVCTVLALLYVTICFFSTFVLVWHHKLNTVANISHKIILLPISYSTNLLTSWSLTQGACIVVTDSNHPLPTLGCINTKLGVAAKMPVFPFIWIMVVHLKPDQHHIKELAAVKAACCITSCLFWPTRYT